MKGRVKRSNKGSMAEFAPCLFVLFLFVVFPMIDLITFATGVCTVQLISRQAASAAASSPTFNGALQAMEDEAFRLADSSLGRFAHITPVGGQNSCGADLVVHVTDVASGTSTSASSNSPNVGAVDTKNKVYEYSVVVTYDVKPAFELTSVPFINQIPVIGKAARITQTTFRSMEYPESLNHAQGIVATQIGGSTSTSSSSSSSSSSATATLPSLP